jgi:hypothetical protein
MSELIIKPSGETSKDDLSPDGCSYMKIAGSQLL